MSMSMEMLVYGFQPGAQKTMQRVIDSLRKEGVEVEVTRIEVRGKTRLALHINGEILQVTPFDGRLVLHLPPGREEVIGVRKTSWLVAESIIHELPSKRIPRMEQARLDAIAAEEARRKEKEEKEKARALAREQIKADFAAQEEEVRVTRAAFDAILSKYRPYVRVRDIYIHVRPPEFHDFYYSGYPDRKAVREPCQPGTAVVQMELTSEELERVLQLLKKD